MALVVAGLQSDLLTFFTGIPTGSDASSARSACATAWANAMQNYAANVTPTSTTVPAATTILQSTLLSIFSTDRNAYNTVLPAMETAFATFAATVASGMTPTSTPPVQSATPPPGLIGFASITFQTSAEQAATTWSSRIDTWFRTGTAIPFGGGGAFPWS